MSATPNPNDSACKEPTKSLNCIEAELAAAAAAQAKLQELATAAKEVLKKGAEAPDTFTKAQSDALPHLQAAEATNTRLEADLKCKLSDDERKELDKCIPTPVGDECKCDAFPDIKVCLCSCSDAAIPSVTDAQLDTLVKCFATVTTSTNALIALATDLPTRAANLAKALAEIEKRLAGGAENPISPERAYLELKIAHAAELAIVRKWTTAKLGDYVLAIRDSIGHWLCLGRKAACAAAAIARAKKWAELEKACKDAESGRSPVDQALDCYHEKTCSPSAGAGGGHSNVQSPAPPAP